MFRKTQMTSGFVVGHVYNIIANSNLTDGNGADYTHSTWEYIQDAYDWLNRDGNGKALCVMGVGPDVFSPEWAEKNPYFSPRVEVVPVLRLR